MPRISKDLRLWEKRVEDFKSSGLSLSEWCKENGVKKTTMSYYCYDRPRNQADKRNMEQNLSLIPVVLKDDLPSSDNSSIEIKIGNASIKVDMNTDLSFLKKVLGVLADDRS